MRSHHFIFFLILLFNSYTIATLNPIIIKGQKLFDSITKEQFFIKGVAYQPRGSDRTTTSDPLANPQACKRDAPLMKELGANVIRVYHVDPTKNHDACMKTFAENGLYVVLGISTPAHSINRDHPEYDVNMYNSYRATVSMFAKYPQVLAFIAGNEVTNSTRNTRAASYVKAVIRDMKSFMRQNSNHLRVVPVGYASNDDASIRDSIKDFFICGDDAETHADFLGLNLYEWCGRATYESSGYAARTKELEAYGRPVFLSEYGCNTVEPRSFGEVEAIYGSHMTSVWSGGVVYEWTPENDYGLVNISNNADVELLTDYRNLYKMLRASDPKGIKMDDYLVPDTLTVPPCPVMSNFWEASTELPPTPSEGACHCMMENLSCVSLYSINKSSNATIGSQLDKMCGLVNCRDISGGEKEQNGGTYGTYSFCNPDQKLSLLYDNFQHMSSGQCDFNGYTMPIIPKRNDISTCRFIKPNTDIAPTQTNLNMANSGPTTTSCLSITLFILYLTWV